jgi:hypothetical protein
MIFRRLAAHLREQNWAAISIEFVLLVVGVFLGIQVANWNEDRQDRQAEQRYLRELVRDLRSDTRGLQGRLENTLSKFALSEQIILEIDPAFERPPFLPSVDTSPKPAGIFRDHAFAGLATTSLVTSSDATFRELVQTGKLAVLFNRNVVNQLVAYYALIEQRRVEDQVALEQIGPMLDYLATRGLSLADGATQEDVVRLAREDVHFLGLVKMAYFLSNWQYAELAKLLAVAESTLARVEDSIEGAP